MDLFKRAWLVRVHTLEFTGLDIAFEVEKSTKREPNKCSLRVWNLTEEHRRELEQLTVNRKRGPGRIRVELHAGYEDSVSLIFRGDLRTAATERDGTDLVTVVEGEDGGRACLWGRINQAFPPGTQVISVLRACVGAMGVGVGNLEEAAGGVRLEAGGLTFTNGTVLAGSAADELERILRSMGLRYSIQNGVIQVLRRNRPLQSTAVVLSPSTGLIGRPAVNADGTVAAQALLIPDLYPGRQVQFQDTSVSGTWRVEKAKYNGDTFGESWYVDLEVQPLLVAT